MDTKGLDIHDTPSGCRFRVKVKPGAKQDMLTAVHGGRLKMTVVAPPEKGKANTAIERVLASALNVATSRVAVVSGHTASEKMVEVSGCSSKVVTNRLETMPRVATGRH